MSPFVGSQLSASELLAAQFADVNHEALHELLVAHFQAEHGARNLVIDSHSLYHGEHECRLTHRRTGSDDDEVAVLPSVSDAVEFVEASRKSAESSLLSLSLLYEFDDLADDGVDLCEVLLHVLLRDGEEHALGFLHKVCHVDGGVEGFRLHQTGEGDELSLQGLLGDDLGVVLDVGRAGHLRIDLHQIDFAASRLQVVGALQLLDDGHDVNGLLFCIERLNGLIDKLMPVVVEALRPQQLCHKAIGALLDHECAEHPHFHVEALRLFVSILVNLWHFHYFRCARTSSS